VSKSAEKSEVVPILLLISMSIALTTHRILNLTSSVGMLNTDSEGTTWWIWSRCAGQSNLGRASGVAFPHGFDLSRLPTFNLVDELRIQLAQIFGCNSSAIIVQLAIFPTFCLIGNSLAGYFLGKSLFHNKQSAFILGMTCAFSSQILLATRTPLANNVMFPGLIAVAFAAKWLILRNRQYLLFVLIFQLLQTLANVYNGFGTFILLTAILFAHPSAPNSVSFVRLKGTAVSILSSVIGLAPLVVSQIYLFTQPKLKDVYRPVDMNAEILPTSSLIAKDRGIYNLLSPASWPRPEAGWLSTPLLLALIILLSLLYLKREKEKKIVTSVMRLLPAVVLLVLLIWDIPFFENLRTLYFQFFFALRGVSNFAKIMPIMITIICLTILQPYLSMKNNSAHEGRRINLLLGLFSFFFLIDNVPFSSSYWRLQDIRPLIQTYGSPDIRRNSGAVAQFPDFMYGPQWGLPQRFIQLAQIGDNRPRLNGRDFQQLNDGSAAMPLPIDQASLDQLLERGATTVMLHQALIPKVDLELSKKFLRSKGFEEHGLYNGKQDELTYQSLDVLFFELR